MLVGIGQTDWQAEISRQIGQAARRMVAAGVPTAERVRRLKILKAALEKRLKPKPTGPAPPSMGQAAAIKFAVSLFKKKTGHLGVVKKLEAKGFSRAEAVRLGTAAFNSFEGGAKRLAQTLIQQGVSHAKIVDKLQAYGLSRADAVRIGTSVFKRIEERKPPPSAEPDADDADACNIWQRIHRFFGGKPDCT